MKSLVAFFVLTYIVAWAFFIPVATTMTAGDPLATWLALAGAFAPSMVAIGLTYRAQGRAGVRALTDHIFQGGVAFRWFVFAALYIAAVKFSVAGILRLATGAWPAFGTEPLYLIAVAMVFSTPVQAGEEIGWRGYALPRLAARIGLGPASIVLGAIWACWHLPLFFIVGVDKFGQSFILYAAEVTALSVTMAWLYARTNCNLLVIMLLHAAVNNTKDIVPSVLPGAADTFGLTASPVLWLTVTLMWMAAVVFLVRMRHMRLDAHRL